MKKSIGTLVVIAILLLGNILFAMRFSQVNSELKKVKGATVAVEKNEKLIGFLNLFVQKVLKSSGEINFDTRFELESAVRNIGDEKVMKAWQAFTDSQNEQEAQQKVEELLELLVSML